MRRGNCKLQPAWESKRNIPSITSLSELYNSRIFPELNERNVGKRKTGKGPVQYILYMINLEINGVSTDR